MKRITDFFTALSLLVILSPILLIIAFLVRCRLGSPIFFIQRRPGLLGRPFKMFKFRTMTDDCNALGELLSDSARLSTFGKFLRSSSLDELPGLWNVLKGDMSLVGPRPLLMEYLSHYTQEQARRHDVRPGITGWAQVNGRNALTWEEKFKLDIWYVDNKTYFLDVKILYLTIKKVFLREGISYLGDATMPKFTGTSKPVKVR